MTVDATLALLCARVSDDGTERAASEGMERDSAHQDSGPQGGGGVDGGAGGGRPQAGFPSTIGELEHETHDPEPLRGEERPG